MGVAISQEARRGGVLVSLQGRLDLTEAARLKEAFERTVTRGGGLIWDLSGLQSMDSSGMSTLVALARDFQPVFFFAPNQHVRTLLTLTNLTASFPILGDAELDQRFPRP